MESLELWPAWTMPPSHAPAPGKDFWAVSGRDLALLGIALVPMMSFLLYVGYDYPMGLLPHQSLWTPGKASAPHGHCRHRLIVLTFCNSTHTYVPFASLSIWYLHYISCWSLFVNDVHDRAWLYRTHGPCGKLACFGPSITRRRYFAMRQYTLWRWCLRFGNEVSEHVLPQCLGFHCSIAPE